MNVIPKHAHILYIHTGRASTIKLYNVIDSHPDVLSATQLPVNTGSKVLLGK